MLKPSMPSYAEVVSLLQGFDTRTLTRPTMHKVMCFMAQMQGTGILNRSTSHPVDVASPKPITCHAQTPLPVGHNTTLPQIMYVTLLGKILAWRLVKFAEKRGILR
ncbi:hypothetical protein I3843_14G131400 [Carya illinoinensis]|nr:hypothetical protein I3843_14G131400 [Carya illinoinensis]